MSSFHRHRAISTLLNGRRSRRRMLMSAAALSLWPALTPALAQDEAEGFWEGASLDANLYYIYRDRDRREGGRGANGEGRPGRYASNLQHSTANLALDFSSGHAGGVVGLDLAAFAAHDVQNQHQGTEFNFRPADTLWGERWDGKEKDGASLYRAALKLKLGDSWARLGYLQPRGTSVIAPNWSYLPGTYRGAEFGTEIGGLSLSYLHTDAYKAPWYRDVYEFRQPDDREIDYLHSLGASYRFDGGVTLEAALGQADDYMNQGFAKVSWDTELAGSPLSLSYQFYGANDAHDDGSVNDVYDGTAWQQAMTARYTRGAFDWRLEFSWVRAPGSQGYFVPRMTTPYASSNGRLDIWWDARSDWNHHDEKAIYAGVTYDLDDWSLPGWAVGVSYAYGWGAKPYEGYADPDRRFSERAWNLNVHYVVQDGWAEGTRFQLHYTDYDNRTDYASWGGGGFKNAFQDERDVKFLIVAPFSLL